MPGSVIIYRIEFQNKQLDTVLIEITDRQLYDSIGDNIVTYVSLKGVAPAFELETFNTEEDKFKNILGQRATIRFKSTNAVNFSTFSTGEDYRFLVRVTAASGHLFVGWLVMDDNQQAFLPPGQPVTLYATDNLGSLKDIELSDFNDSRPKGKYRLIEILAWCLRKTEGPYVAESAALYSGIKVSMNLFESNHHSTVNNCPLNQTYVDLLTFEKSINVYKDCYTVLTEILFSLGARLCHYDGYWYILRIDEYKNSAFVVHTYTLGAVYVSRTLGATFDKDLDSSDIDFVEAQTIQRIQRPYKSSILIKDHEFPEEIPSNSAFLRGTARSDSDPTLTQYDIEDWTQYKGPPNVTNDGDAYIRVLNDAANKETERFVVLPVQPTNLQYYIESPPIYVCAKDKFGISVDIRHNGQVETAAGTGNYNVMQVRLYADDGTYYTLDPIDLVTTLASWVASNSTFSTNNKYFKRFYDGTEDDTEWHSISTSFEDVPAIPKTGYLTICLHQTKKSDQFETHFSNLSFDYAALVDGTYKKTTGEHYKMSTSLRYSKKYEETTYLFDAPCKLFKGALFYFSSPNYYLTANWVDFAMEQYAIPDLLDYAYTFLHWQINATWNQNRLETRLLPARLFGMDVTNGYAGLIHKYSVLNDPNYSGLNFIILSMRQDWHNCTWSATFAAINDESNVRQGGGSSGENFEFKYLS